MLSKRSGKEETKYGVEAKWERRIGKPAVVCGLELHDALSKRHASEVKKERSK